MISREEPLVIYPLSEASLVTSHECDCACPSPIQPTGSGDWAPENLMALQTKVDRSAHFVPVNEDYRVGFSPSMPVMPIVINTAAYQLIQMFRSPRPITRAFEAYAHADVIPTIVKLLNSGLLQADSNTSTDPWPDEPATLVAWLHVTNACNLACTYCYLDKTDETLSPEIGHAAIEAIFRAAVANGFGAVKLKYSGGEPTLNFSLIPQLHQHACALAERYGLRLDEVILSNGVRWTPEMTAAVRACGIRVMISMDGIGATHDAQRTFADGCGSSAIIVRTIRSLLEHGIVPHISVTVTGQSAEGLPDLVTWLLERDLPFSLNFHRGNARSASSRDPGKDPALNEECIIAAMRAAFRAIEGDLPHHSLLGNLLDRASMIAPHRYPCAVGRNYLVIDHHGHVAKCQMQITRTVTTVDDADPLGPVRADRTGIQNPSVDEKEGCRDCQWRYWCAGGCPFVAYQASGRYDSKSPNCDIYKALFPEVLRLEGLRLLTQEIDLQA
jgi:uncharacterized protein